MFENLTRDVSARTGLTEGQSSDLLRAVTARLLHNEQGGFAALLATIRRDEPELVAQWLGDDPMAGVIASADVDRFLGADWASKTATDLGISEDAARSGGAVATPVIVDQLTPGGLIPAASELEASYGGWAGGHVVKRLSTDHPPLADFPTEPSDERIIEMELGRPAEPVVARAADGPATLLPWAILVVGLLGVTLATVNSKPEGITGEGHKAAHSAAGPEGSIPEGSIREGSFRQGQSERREGSDPLAGPNAVPGSENKAQPPNPTGEPRPGSKPTTP